MYVALLLQTRILNTMRTLYKVVPGTKSAGVRVPTPV